MKKSFNPADVNLMGKVVNEACLKIGCADERAKELLALRVLRRAAEGEHDFETLMSVALNDKHVSMERKRQTFRGTSVRNAMHRMTQAQRARALAAKWGPSLVADLLEEHAQLCERNAASMAVKGRPRRK